MKSAQYAGFIDAATGRLVNPAFRRKTKVLRRAKTKIAAVGTVVTANRRVSIRLSKDSYRDFRSPAMCGLKRIGNCGWTFSRVASS